jgi:hypothetical protein
MMQALSPARCERRSNTALDPDTTARLLLAAAHGLQVEIRCTRSPAPTAAADLRRRLRDRTR